MLHNKANDQREYIHKSLSFEEKKYQDLDLNINSALSIVSKYVIM